MSARAGFRRFIGIDLGGGRGKNTAVARLECSPRGDDDAAPRLAVVEAKVRHGHRGTGHGDDDPGGAALFRDEVLTAYIDRWVDDETVVAINAPLTLPPCIRCTLPCPGVARCDVPVVVWMRRWAPRLLDRPRSDRSKPAVTPYTQRATELLLAATGIQPREALGQGTGPLAARAAYLRRTLSPRLRLHENLLEVHPKATLTRMLGSKVERRSRQGETGRVWDARKEILTGLAEGIAFDYVWPELVVRNPHVFDAVICGFTAFLWSRGAWSGPPDFADATGTADAANDLAELWVEDGWIWAPPPR